jgi:hypothetical protein
MKSQKTFLIIAGVITIAGCVAVLLYAHSTAETRVQPFTVVYSRSNYSPVNSENPTNVAHETLAIRSDGAFVKSNSTLDSHGHFPLAKGVTLADRYVLVDPVTESTTTYGPVKSLVKPTNNCGGNSGENILGYRTELTTREENIKDGTRITVRESQAPALNCIPLRQEIVVEPGEGGNFRVVRAAEVVTEGEPSAELFTIPASYQERSPATLIAEHGKKMGGKTTIHPAIEDVYQTHRFHQLADAH